MARIDSILCIVVSQNANELRLGVEKEPKILAYGTQKRLSIPRMSEDTLRALLGEILTPDADAAIKARQRHESSYDAGPLGTYNVSITAPEGGGFDVTFVKSAVATSPSTTASPSTSTSTSTSTPTSTSTSTTTPTTDDPPVRVHRQIALTEAFASLIAHAAALRASDLHLADRDEAFARIDGKLRPLELGSGLDIADLLLLGVEDRTALRHGRSIDASLDVTDIGRVRVHVYTAEHGLALAARLLPSTAPSFASLNMPIAFDDVALLPHGLVLVCGATGSGKSTTLAALAQETLRRRSVVLVTLEDPIELALSAPRTSILRRRQIGRDAPTFAAGLRDALREDPDVLLVGEMRDPETIALALTAAETGHLVLASLHSRGAPSAIERIVDAYPAEQQSQVRGQLAGSLRVVVSQRLLPRARGSGRLPAVEVMRVNHAVASIIRDGKHTQLGTAIQAGRAEGMLPLERCLAERVLAGEIKLEDARAAADDVPALMQLIEGREGR